MKSPQGGNPNLSLKKRQVAGKMAKLQNKQTNIKSSEAFKKPYQKYGADNKKLRKGFLVEH